MVFVEIPRKIVPVLPRSCTIVTRTHVHYHWRSYTSVTRTHVQYHWTRHAHMRLPKPGDNNTILFPPFFPEENTGSSQLISLAFLIFSPFLFLNLSLDFENQGKNAGNVTKHAATLTYFELCFFCLAQIKMPSNKIFFIFQSKI